MLTRSRLRTTEAIAALSIASVVVRLLPFSWLARLAGEPGALADGQHEAPTEEGLWPPTEEGAMQVSRAIHSGVSRLPWMPTCLMQALAGRLMLRRRGAPSRLVIGVNITAGQLRAHAWLLAGGGVVCGGREAAGFNAVTVFRG